MGHLFQEYEEQSTAESHVVKDLDKFDMIFQAYEYEQLENKPGYLQEFFDSTEGKTVVVDHLMIGDVSQGILTLYSIYILVPVNI